MNAISKNLDGYGTPPIEWERVRDVLTSEITQGPDAGGPNRHTAWLTTINPDGSPHLTPVGFAQLGGVWYFTSGHGTRKSRNIAADARCVVSVATHPFDLVIEGSAERVADADELRSVADEYVRRGVARAGRGRRLDSRIQRAVGGSAAVACLQDHSVHGVRLRHRRAVRRHEIRPHAMRFEPRVGLHR
jgi:hypothetical protein